MSATRRDSAGIRSRQDKAFERFFAQVCGGGAFAKDRARLVVGASNGLLSERGARRHAERRCRKPGGRDCEVALSFRDSCAVIALPVEIVDGMVIHEASAATVEEASRLGLAACEADSGAGTCRIGYANCTAPYFVY